MLREPRPTISPPGVHLHERTTLAAAAQAPAPRSLLGVFNATVARCGDRVAVEAGDAVLSYCELSEAAQELAARLQSLGIGPGDRVGVRVSSGTAQLYVAILGVLSAGAAYVPVDADDPRARAAAIWKGSGACAVVENGLAISELAAVVSGDRQLRVDDDAWVIFTSGSSGEPKGVAVTHRSAAALVDAEARLWSLAVEDRVLAGLSVGFDASCEEMWLAWRHGATLVPAPRAVVRSGVDFGHWIAENGITAISTVPTLAAMWDSDALRDVRLLILGGEACAEALAWRVSEDREVWNTYGPTEATVVTTAGRLYPGQPVTIGWPLDGWRLAVVDEVGEPVAFGEDGELVIGGVGLGRYLDQALETRFAGIERLGWARAYRTGDIVRETMSGLEFVGRQDDQVKLGGRRLELGEIDARLSAVSGVRAAASAVHETAAGNQLLVGYVVGEVDPTVVRARVAEWLPEGIVPLVVVVDSLPAASSGKLDRNALPWPRPPRDTDVDGGGENAGAPTGTAAWLAERWEDQLGPVPITPESDFFELGGNSLAAAKLVSVLRSRFPTVAVADVYNHRRLGTLAARLDRLEVPVHVAAGARLVQQRRWGAVQLAGILLLLAFVACQWVIGILALDNLQGGGLGPQMAWGWLIAGWLVLASAPGRALIVLVARRLMIGRLRPGRYPRRGWLACRMWFVERLAEVCRLEGLAGTPWAARYARISGHEVGRGVRLGTLPPATSLIHIGAGATLEPDVDVEGWWIDGHELVIGELRIGAGARIGTRSLLLPGADVGAGAEIEPGSVVRGSVPANERWAGCPARCEGGAGHDWPLGPPARSRLWPFWKAMYGAGLGVQTLLPLAAALPGLLLLRLMISGPTTLDGAVSVVITAAPLLAISFLVTYAILVALLFRGVSRLLTAGWHTDQGAVAWASWFSAALMDSTRAVMFPLYSSIYTRTWLRLLGVRVGKRTEVSTAVGLDRLTSLAEKSFAADDVVFAGTRARGGWLHVAPIEVGSGTFLGNGAILGAGSKLGDDCLLGVLTVAPHDTADGTSWLGAPPLELPRVPDCPDPSRTTNPSRRLVLSRGVMDAIRILLPASASVGLAALTFWALEAIAAAAGLWTMAASAPLVLLAAGICAALFTVAVKWLLMGRYRPGEHPLWSSFVWRDEIVNSCQEQLAGVWLLNPALATPLVPVYLRAMGASVGKDVWCDTLAITEFDLVELGDGCTINRRACIETHLFHDRLMRIGPAVLGPASTLGPSSAVLPDTRLGAGCCVGGRSVVLRGEELPSNTRWHGAPVESF